MSTAKGANTKRVLGLENLGAVGDEEVVRSSHRKVANNVQPWPETLSWRHCGTR